MWLNGVQLIQSGTDYVLAGRGTVHPVSSLILAGSPDGVCAKQSANGIQFPTDSLPTPAAFFPLSDYWAQSWPLGDKGFFNTSSTTVGWSQDQTFGNVVNCPVRHVAHFIAQASSTNCYRLKHASIPQGAHGSINGGPTFSSLGFCSHLLCHQVGSKGNASQKLIVGMMRRDLPDFPRALIVQVCILFGCAHT